MLGGGGGKRTREGCMGKKGRRKTQVRVIKESTLREKGFSGEKMLSPFMHEKDILSLSGGENDVEV